MYKDKGPVLLGSEYNVLLKTTWHKLIPSLSVRSFTIERRTSSTTASNEKPRRAIGAVIQPQPLKQDANLQAQRFKEPAEKTEKNTNKNILVRGGGANTCKMKYKYVTTNICKR